MFIYFLQKKLLLDSQNENYLSDKLKYSIDKLGKNKFYDTFLTKLFFEGFAKVESQRAAETNKLIGKIKYLNGGLFLKHKIEQKYKGKIKICDEAFENLFTLFNKYSWTLDDTPGGKDDEINPDVLGYIFEKYINQKAFGAYYTRPEITEYLCEQTINKLILDEINDPDINPELLKKSGLDKFGKPVHYLSIEELFINLDSHSCKKLIVGDDAILPNMRLLDPASGSGAFLVAAMKTLINVYSAILGKIDFLGDKELVKWKKEIEQNHPNINYYIKKQIITNNLYGVDIMEEATEIAKLRLFLALVASAKTVDQLEPLPNIDFNIMCGNSLIGLMRVDESEYNKYQSGDMFKKSYHQLVNEREAAINSYKSFENTNDIVQIKKDSIEIMEAEANEILNVMLGHEFSNLGIKYEQIIWDNKKNKEGKSVKRNINIDDINALEPFHWGYEFSEIFRKKDGFDAIITNPPWEIFKPTSKEFFNQHTDLLIQRKMRIEDFFKEKDKLLEDESIRREWLNYLSKFPHVSHYFRISPYYKHQTSIIGEKKSGSDINLYKLFLEQSINLLKNGGRCGIIIPSGIYLDAGNKELRNLLFNSCKIENLYGISNEKFLFEEVEHNIKYTLLSFLKGQKTDKFNICFRINPRIAVSAKELDFFLNDISKNICISINQVNLISPTSLAIPEIKSEDELKLLLKISKLPLLGDNILKFGNEFHMTNDSDIFKVNSKSKSSAILCEGKMIHHYKYNYSKPRYWINILEGRKRLLGKKDDISQILPYQRYRIAFRGIARSTDSRTMISTILPPYSFSSNSLAVVVNDISYLHQLYYLGIFNSLTFDFTLRSKISSNLNFFYIYNIPFPVLKSDNIWYKHIINCVAELICTTMEFSSLWEDVQGAKWNEKDAVINEEKRNQLMAEIDGIVAHIYGLTEEEFEYILSTFPVVQQQQKTAALDEYRKISNYK